MLLNVQKHKNGLTSLRAFRESLMLPNDQAILCKDSLWKVERKPNLYEKDCSLYEKKNWHVRYMNAVVRMLSPWRGKDVQLVPSDLHGSPRAF